MSDMSVAYEKAIAQLKERLVKELGDSVEDGEFEDCFKGLLRNVPRGKGVSLLKGYQRANLGSLVVVRVSLLSFFGHP